MTLVFTVDGPLTRDVRADLADRIRKAASEIECGATVDPVVERLASCVEALARVVAEEVRSNSPAVESAAAPGGGVAQVWPDPFDLIAHLPREPYTVVVMTGARWVRIESADRWELHAEVDPRDNPAHWRLKSVDTLDLIYPDKSSERVSVTAYVRTGPADSQRPYVVTLYVQNPPQFPQGRLVDGVAPCAACGCCTGTYENYRGVWLCSRCADGLTCAVRKLSEIEESQR